MNINGFKSSFTDFARSNLFEVQVNRLNGQKMKFHVKAAQIPGSNIQPIIVPYMGRQIKIPGDREYEDWTVEVMVDNSFQLRNDLYAWHEEINSTVSNIGPGAVNGVKSDATVKALGKNGSTLVTYRFIGLFPTQVAAMDYNKDNNNTIANLSVTFAFDWHERA